MFQIDSMSRTPIYEQLIDQLEKMIASGALSEGDQIPSVRATSTELGINPVTILKSYTELDGRGLIRAVPGRGYFVCEGAKEILTENKMKDLGERSRIIGGMASLGVPREAIEEILDEAYRDPMQGKESDDK